MKASSKTLLFTGKVLKISQYDRHTCLSTLIFVYLIKTGKVIMLNNGNIYEGEF